MGFPKNFPNSILDRIFEKTIMTENNMKNLNFRRLEERFGRYLENYEEINNFI
jgi:hypothetical protein